MPVPIRPYVLAMGLWLTACQSVDPRMVEARTASLYPHRAGASAAADATESPSLDEVRRTASLASYLNFGLRHSGTLRNAYETWRAAVERTAQTTSLPDPVASFSQFVEDLQTRTGPQRRRYGLTQNVPWPGKLRQRGRISEARAEELWQQVEARRLAVQRDIAVTFHEYGYLGQSLRIKQRVLELLRQLEPVVQSRIRAGAGQQDLLRLQVEIGRVENDLASLVEIRPALSARLAAAMGYPSDDLLPLPETSEPTLRKVDRARLVELAADRNPKVREFAAAVVRHRHALELSQTERWPDLSVGVDYLETGSAVNPATPGSGRDPWAWRVGFSVPIWVHRYDAAERQAEHELTAASAALHQLRGDLRADVEHAGFALNDALRQVALYRDTLLPRARELLDVTRAAYRAGRAALLDLLDSERSLLDFEVGYWRATRDYLQSEARVAALVGGGFR
ncbi:MAG: TolC family protein [Planctomycetes bacterium]|nr:TolC family protein [Planctomycetota bacterium]